MTASSLIAPDVTPRVTVHAPGRLTLRDQALRMTADVVWLYLALDIVLAGSTDQPVDRWDEMYIPEELAAGLRTVTPRQLGSRALVESEQQLASADRAPPRRDPPARFVSMLLVGLGIGLIFVALTIPLTRLTDWIGRRQGWRGAGGGVV